MEITVRQSLETPLEGDVWELVLSWDAGTEIDETPGEGPNQAPRQPAADTGGDQGSPIAPVAGYEGAVTVMITAEA